MSYKAIISDVDGTLLGTDSQIISGTVKAAIGKWLHTGHEFSLATGRQYIHIKDICHDLQLSSPIIVRGGSEIVDPMSGNILNAEYINYTILSVLVDKLNDSYIPFSAEKDTVFYTSTGKPFIDIPFTSTEHINKMPHNAVPKIVLWTDTMDENFVEEFVEKEIVKKFPTLHVIKSYTPVRKTWDITSEKATKYLAVHRLAKLLEIRPQQIVGVGDGYNDYPLLTACGYKVAMSNAHKELKAIADYIAPSYKEDGIAVLINKLLKN